MVRQQFEEWLETWVADVAEEIDKERAERVAELFERSNYVRQKDLADELDVEIRTVQRWLAGGSISKRHWQPLAAALNTSIRFLIFGEAEEPDESQVDRIEAKLDAIMAHLGITLPAKRPVDVARRAAQRREAQDTQAPSARPPQKRKGRAA